MERSMIKEPVEMWRPVVGHEGKYEVSDQGRVRSLDCILTYVRRDQYSGRDLMIRRVHSGRMLRPGPSKSGHLSVVLGRKEGSRLIHHLVLEAFVGPCPDKHEGCHGNDVPDDNRLDNLRWGTRSDNIKDAIKNGGKCVGERSWQAKLTSADVQAIRAKFADRSNVGVGHYDRSLPSMAAEARARGVSETTVRNIARGESRRHG
jgi:HNH endonuclease/NUMOD4 motif